MPFPSLILGFKLVWRNKRRFVVVMSGVILAIGIIGALFLVASNQSHEMGVSFLKMFRQPISLMPGTNRVNMTEYDDMEGVIMQSDAAGTNIVDDVIHELDVTSSSPSTYNVVYFLTKNQTINWMTFSFNETIYANLTFTIRDRFDLYGEPSPGRTLTGRVPAAAREVMVSASMAAMLNISINDTISIGNVEAMLLDPGYTVVGILATQGFERDELFVRYPDFVLLRSAIWGSVHVVTGFSMAMVRVQIDLSTVTIFNVNEIVENVNLLAFRIQLSITHKGYAYAVYNDMQGMAGVNYIIIVFTIMYLLLMAGMLLPAIILSAYISKTIGQEMFDRRAGEFSQFRSRGFSRQQMIQVLSSEVLVSSVFCSGIAGLLGIGMAYIFQPIAATFSPLGFSGTGGSAFSPFIFPETASIYVAIIVVLALLFVLGTYMQPMKLSFQREMIDSLKEKIRASRQEKQLVGGIVAMYLLGAIPLGFYLLLQALLPGQPATQAIQTFSPVISALAIAAPFFLALGTIKLLGEKKPAIFGRICTALFPRSKASLKHIATRNISSKASKIARISMIVLFTIAFGFCVKVTFDSLIAFRMEKMRILVGNDISGSYTGSIAELNDTRVHIATMPNVTRSSSYIETYCMVINNDDPFFTYQGFNCNLMNLSEYIAAISTRNDKYLHEATWAGLLQAVAGNPDVVVLPSSLKSHVHGPTLTIKIPYYTGSGYGYFTKQYTIAGYYKVFPGVVVESQSLYYDIIVNENPWIALQHETNYLTMTTCIDTLLVDQGGIDDFAARMNFTTYKTMSNMTDASGLIGMMPLVEMPIFYNLLDIDSWLALSIALFGIAVISFMRINAERKEIGLYRIRGFDATMLFTTQLAEKYVPILIGGIVGVGAGIASGWLAATSIALNFQAFNPVVNYPMEFVITGGTILLQAIIPLVLYLAIIMLAIKNEIRQELGNIMDEED